MQPRPPFCHPSAISARAEGDRPDCVLAECLDTPGGVCECDVVHNRPGWLCLVAACVCLGPASIAAQLPQPVPSAAAQVAGTTKGIGNIDRWLALDGGPWDVIHFNFGLHDLKRVDARSRNNSDDPSSPPQADLATYSKQLTNITDKLEACGARLIFATTTPVPPGKVRPHRDPKDVELYNAAARAIMIPRQIAMDDLYAFALPLLAELQVPVNVHFTPEGSVALAHEVARSIQAATTN